MNLKGKNFLKLLDLTSEEISGLLDLAALAQINKVQIQFQDFILIVLLF